MKTFAMFCCALLAGLPAAAAHTRSWSETREFNLPFSGAFDAATGVGAITVSAWENAYVLVRAQVHANASDEYQARLVAAMVRIDAFAGRVRASGPSGKSWAVSYEIFTPRETALALSTGVGAISISDIAGPISAATSVGAVELTRLAGAVDAKTSVGAIAVALAGSRWEGRGLVAETGTGAIRITAPDDYSASFDLRTGMGAIVARFPGARVEAAGFFSKTLVFDAGSGGPPIRATTGIGQIELAGAPRPE